MRLLWTRPAVTGCPDWNNLTLGHLAWFCYRKSAWHARFHAAGKLTRFEISGSVDAQLPRIVTRSVVRILCASPCQAKFPVSSYWCKLLCNFNLPAASEVQHETGVQFGKKLSGKFTLHMDWKSEARCTVRWY